MLLEELPAEVSFHVPESYHKRIIGVGGKNIQRIMKLYGVYVKFSNAEEFAALGGYLDNEDNVVARTPAKNAINLESLKQSVMELVNPKVRGQAEQSQSCVDCMTRTRTTLWKAFPFPVGITEHCWARRVYSSTTLSTRPTRLSGCHIRKRRAISLPFLARNPRSTSLQRCFWCVATTFLARSLNVCRITCPSKPICTSRRMRS